MSEEIKEIKKLVTDTQTLFNELKSKQEETAKKYGDADAETKATMTKLAEKVADNIEKGKGLQDAIDKVATMANSGVTATDEKKENGEKARSLFNDYLRMGQEFKTFDSYVKSRTDVETKTFLDMSNPAGGFLVMPESLGLRTTRAFETSPMRQLSTVNSTSKDRVVILLDDDDIDTIETLKENEEATTSDTPDLSKIIIPVHTLGKKIKISMEQLEDPDFDVVSFAQNKISRKIARVQNTAFVSGTGAAGAKGFLQYAASSPSALTVASSYTRGTIQTYKTGTAGTYTTDQIIELTGKVLEDYQSSSKFLMRRATFVDLILNKSGEGDYLFNRALDKKPGVPFDILGYPVVFASDMPAIASDALAFAFGDFKECYQIVDRMGLKVVRDDLSVAPNTYIHYFVRYGGGAYGFDSVKLLKLSA
ncbi:MAG: phage major capsid protein [Candidatus Scalindua sp.]|nr:phage major capsid protein [Candidatus Scalindua sp.]